MVQLYKTKGMKVEIMFEVFVANSSDSLVQFRKDLYLWKDPFNLEI